MYCISFLLFDLNDIKWIHKKKKNNWTALLCVLKCYHSLFQNGKKISSDWNLMLTTLYLAYIVTPTSFPGSSFPFSFYERMNKKRQITLRAKLKLNKQRHFFFKEVFSNDWKKLSKYLRFSSSVKKETDHTGQKWKLERSWKFLISTRS